MRARIPTWLGLVVVGVLGAVVGLLVGGRTTQRVGPFDARFALSPSLRGDTVVEVPPLGTLRVDSHDGPAQLTVTLDRIDPAAAERLIQHPDELTGLADRAADDVYSALVVLVARGVLGALAGAALLSLAVHHDWRRAALSAGVAALTAGATVATTVATWDPVRLREPTYSGLLANAPALVGDVRDIASRFDVYRKEVSALVTNVSKLYATTSSLPVFQPAAGTLRVLHVSDLHLNPEAFDLIRTVVKQFDVQAVVDTGDLTDWGSQPETTFVEQIGLLGVPYVYVRGNHDSTATAAAVARQPHAIVLEGTEREVTGLVFAGIGDPRFTPDKQPAANQDDQPVAAGQQLAHDVAGFPRRPDVLLVHDPTAAPPLAGAVPLVLAGHIHQRDDQHLGSGTTLLVEGSTGGAGLRGLEHEKPTPLECSVLYFDAGSRRLQAYDTITVGGLGQSTATIERHIAEPAQPEPAQPEPAQPSPAGSPASPR